MTNKSKSSLIFFTMVLFLILTGCAKQLAKNYPERSYYILNVPQSDKDLSPTSGLVLEIKRFQISPGFAGKEFVYRTGNHSYVSDFYNQFFRPPVLLIREQVNRWLSESRGFSYVVESSNNVEPDYILEGNVKGLYGDFRKNNPPKAVLEIQFFLIGGLSDQPRIISRNNYRKEVNLSSNSPDKLVEGWNEALSQILMALHDDFNKLDLDGEK